MPFRFALTSSIVPNRTRCVAFRAVMGTDKMTAMDDLFARYTGQTVPVSFNVGFVALSYVVSLLGAGSTLELINRRTSLKGLYNQ